MLQLYKNIKKRRLELQLTQTDLATKLGYADKSMIAKIEKGLVDLPQSKILAFADVLQTSPSDLMGLEQIDTNFSGKEAPKEIYDKFKSNVSKNVIPILQMKFADFLLINTKKETAPAPTGTVNWKKHTPMCFF